MPRSGPSTDGYDAADARSGQPEAPQRASPRAESASTEIARRGALRLALFPSFFWRSEGGEPRGVGFATTRLAAGAAAVRDMIVDAWLDSANTPIRW